ncbi:MAG: thrombospondin type 3 repeat-containing protein [Gemmatimonadales bacterium]|nr:thrombospondin type 3 repeat-containing protein [Gemmatimonadales bacterium]
MPALAMAQQRPTPPPQRPAAQPAQRPAQTAMGTSNRSGAIAFTAMPTAFVVSDGALNDNILDALAGENVGSVIPGIAGSVVYQLSPKLGVGVGVGFGTGNGLTLIAPSAGLGYTLSPTKRTSPYVLAVVSASKWTGDFGNTSATGVGGGGGLGIRHMAGENLAVRLEGRVGFESYTDESVSSIVGRAGLGVTYLMGGGPARDTDGDGVPDKRDRCAGTARGATVDVRGCTSDTDRDGIVNGLDRCPNTPANTPVDANGCTRDTDSDGIADNLDRCPNTPSNARPLDANGCPVDADRDGVADYQDRCASTAAGTPVDAAGCPRDTDGDGVLDNADRCPGSPAGTPVDANGCPRDIDGDGVADNLDRCANTAAGTQVDATGCPVQRDADGDGVIDANDRCANTARTARVDANGCPLAELPAAGATMILRNINFAVGGARLTPSSLATLDGIAAAIVATPGSRWEIGGYTSAVGTAALNQRLSQARAQSVMDYLVSKGVARDQLTAVGYGPQRPVAPNTTAAGRAQNRRVEIKRL